MGQCLECFGRDKQDSKNKKRVQPADKENANNLNIYKQKLESRSTVFYANNQLYNNQLYNNQQMPIQDIKDTKIQSQIKNKKNEQKLDDQLSSNIKSSPISENQSDHQQKRIQSSAENSIANELNLSNNAEIEQSKKLQQDVENVVNLSQRQDSNYLNIFSERNQNGIQIHVDQNYIKSIQISSNQFQQTNNEIKDINSSQQSQKNQNILIWNRELNSFNKQIDSYEEVKSEINTQQEQNTKNEQKCGDYYNSKPDLRKSNIDNYQNKKSKENPEQKSYYQQNNNQQEKVQWQNTKNEQMIGDDNNSKLDLRISNIENIEDYQIQKSKENSEPKRQEIRSKNLKAEFKMEDFGIKNLGNTCYINSALQMLRQIYEENKLFLEQKSQVANKLKIFFDKLNQKNLDQKILRYLISLSQQIQQQEDRGGDSYYTAFIYLSQIIKESNNNNNNNINQYHLTPFQQIFTIVFQDGLACSKCSYYLKNEYYVEENDSSLDYKNFPDYQIESIFEGIELNQICQCNKKNKSNIFKPKRRIIFFPQFLIVKLPYNQYQGGNKKETLQFDSGVKYQLIGYCNYTGYHYTYTANKNGTWTTFDDSNIYSLKNLDLYLSIYQLYKKIEYNNN